MIVRLLLALLLLSLGIAAPAAAADTYTLAPTQDTDVRANTASNNCGACTTLSARKHSTGEHRPLYQFDLSGVPASATLVSATLRIWVTDNESQAVTVHRITQSWAENSLTWANSSGVSHIATSSGTFTPATVSRYYDVDVTALVTQWRSGTANYGVLLKLAGTNTQAAFTSREWATVSQRPQLVVVVNPKPSFTIVASSTLEADPYNGAVNPKHIPGATLVRALSVTNTSTGLADTGTVAVIEPVPADTSLYVGNFGGVGSGPVTVTQGTPSSNVTYSFTSLASTTDDLSFSNNNGSSFLYTPSPDASGYDPAVTHIRVNPKGVFAGSSGAGDPSFTLRFRVKVD